MCRSSATEEETHRNARRTMMKNAQQQHHTTFEMLWRELRSTYEANERNMVASYGGPVMFEIVDRVYANNKSIVKSVLLANTGPVSEELLNSTLQKNIFLTMLTLKRNNHQPHGPVKLNECRLYNGGGGSSVAVAAAATTAVEKSYDGDDVVSVVADRWSLITGDDRGGDDDDDDEDDGQTEEEQEEEEEEEDEVEEFNNVGSSDNNGRKRARPGAATNRLQQQGKSFTAKGIRRQHWAQRAYRNFFHQFLFTVRSMRVVEQLDFYVEDKKY